MDLVTNRGKLTPNESFQFFTSGRAYTPGKLNKVFGTNSHTPPMEHLARLQYGSEDVLIESPE